MIEVYGLDSYWTRRWNNECQDDIECRWCCPRSRWCRLDSEHSMTWSRSRWTTAADPLRSWVTRCCNWARTGLRSSRSRSYRDTIAFCRRRSTPLRISLGRLNSDCILRQPSKLYHSIVISFSFILECFN